MTLDLEKYALREGVTPLSAEELNQRFYSLVRRLHELEQLKMDWEQAVAEVQNHGLSRINDAVAPLLEGLRADMEAVIALGEAAQAEQAAAVAAKLADAEMRLITAENTFLSMQAVMGAHASRQDNPHNVTASQLGLGNVLNMPQINPNFSDNSGLTVWQRSTDDTGVTTTRKYVADRIAVKTGAGTLAHVRQSTVVSAGCGAKYSMEMNGAAGVTTVDFDQRYESLDMPEFKRIVTISAQIQNMTGAPFTPQLFLSTPGAVDNWTTPTVINGGGAGEALQACPDGTWTTISWTGDLSAYANIDNGLEVRIRVPSGALVAGKTVRITALKVEPGSIATPLVPWTVQEELARCLRYCFKTNGQYMGLGNASTQAVSCVPFPVPMRASPTFTSLGGTQQVWDGLWLAVGSYSINLMSTFSAAICCNVSTGITVGHATLWQPAGGVFFDAEL